MAPSDRDGVGIVDDWDGFGQRRTGTGTTTFTDVAAAADEVQHDSPYDPKAQPTVQYASLQLYIHAVAGILANVVEDGVALLKSRERNFRHGVAERLADDPRLQRQLGELVSTAYVGRAAVLDAAAIIGAATDSTVAGVPDATLAREAQFAVAKVKVVHLDRVARRPPRGCWNSAGRARRAVRATSTGVGATSARPRCTTRWRTRRG